MAKKASTTASSSDRPAKRAKVTSSVRAKSAEPESVTITYDLFDLPTAQHKAGLAGLLLQIDSMRERNRPAPTYRFDDNACTTKVYITFTRDTCNSLFDDAYDAELVEAKSKSKWQGAELVRMEEAVEEVDGKRKVTKLFVYRVTQPTGHFLKGCLRNAPDVWLKLWRDMLWTIPRGNPQSREPFEQRAAGQTCKEGPAAWGDLLKATQAATENEFRTDAVAGSLWLGAQALNAENIAFKGRVEQTLLLHFWPLTTLVFVPQSIDSDGDAEFVGYVLAIPEVSDLPDFMADYRSVLEQLGDQKRGYRPAEAVIDIAAEGALMFLEHLTMLSRAHSEDVSTSMSVSGVEFLHQVKLGNNIKQMAAGRIVPRPHLVKRYHEIVGSPNAQGERQRPYGNPLFRRGLLLALLSDTPWFRPFGRMFAEWPHTMFVPSDNAPPRLSWFWGDVRKYLQREIYPMTDTDLADPANADARLMLLINRLVRSYLSERAKKKSGIDPEKHKEGEKVHWDSVPQSYKDARRDAGESLFLEFRSRREQAFVDHFAQTLFAAKQYLSEDQFTVIGQALLNRTEDVKTLTLMALSANS